MQYVKKISALLLIWFMLIVVVGSAKQIEERTMQSYTFSYYADYLSKTFVPAIQEFIESTPIIPYSKEKGETLVKGVIGIIDLHLESTGMLIPPGRQYPVSLIVVPPNKDSIIVYYVNIVLPLVEYDDKGKIPSVLIFSKNFFCGRESLAKKQNI